MVRSETDIAARLALGRLFELLSANMRLLPAAVLDELNTIMTEYREIRDRDPLEVDRLLNFLNERGKN